MNERDRFAVVVLPHLDAAYNLARWLVGDPALAEDVVQEAMVRAFRHFAGFRGENGRGWVLQIVRNTAHTSLRQRQATRAEPLPAGDDPDELVDPSPDPEQGLALRQDRARLDQALASLPVELRECVVLAELEELSYREIARIMAIPIGTVMSRLWRARRALARFARAAEGRS